MRIMKFVMVGNNQVKSERAGMLGFTNSSDAAVDGDDKSCSGLPDSFQGGGIQPYPSVIRSGI
jgi:hypothetical protein